MKRVVLGLFFVCLALAGVVVIRALMLAPAEQEIVPPEPLPGPEVALKLAKSLTFRTISTGTGYDAEFANFYTWLETTWPHFRAQFKMETFLSHSRLYTWSGTDISLNPIVFLAHSDVVPVEEGTEKDWVYPPFDGVVAPCVDEDEDCIWGRGAVDMKAALIGLVSAADELAAQGYVPKRTLMFAFGHDEEVGGKGAQAIAERLRVQGIQPEWILDEGLLVTEGIVPNIDRQVAYIGIAEKGYLSLELTATGDGGHSSMPPQELAVSRLARAIYRLSENPFPARLDGLTQLMFEQIAPHLPFAQKLAFANQWLFGGQILGTLESAASTNALIRTTQAPTMLSGSVQDNVLPQKAQSVINYRIHPRDSIDSVIDRVEKIIDDDSISVRKLTGGLQSEPSPISSTTSPGYTMIHQAIRSVFPNALVSPGLFIAATDSRHYLDLAKDVYRFHPIRMNPKDRKRIHGSNERLRVSNFRQVVAFYRSLLRMAGEQ